MGSPVGPGQVLVKFEASLGWDMVKTQLGPRRVWSLDQVPGKSRVVLRWLSVKSQARLGQVSMKSQVGLG